MSGETTKTIQFDPNLLLGKKTRKQKPPPVVQNKTRKSQGAVNYSLLKEIRRNQIERNRKMLLQGSDGGSLGPNVVVGGSKDDTNFGTSLQYLSQIKKPNVEVSNRVAFGGIQPATTGSLARSSKDVQSPGYGCLKVGGLLPCYRTWKATGNTVGSLTGNTVGSFNGGSKWQELGQIMNLEQKGRENDLQQELQSQQSQQEQQEQQELQSQQSQQEQRQRQRRNVRTYRVGKSKVRPHVSVLLSSKTTRRNVTARLKELKTEPVTKVKQKLIRDGFVRMGTTAPENLLREIHRNVAMIGEVKNYSPDIMLYNLAMNDK